MKSLIYLRIAVSVTGPILESKGSISYHSQNRHFWGLIAVSLLRSVHTVRRLSLVRSLPPALPLETKILYALILYRQETTDPILPLSRKAISEFTNLLP